MKIFGLLMFNYFFSFMFFDCIMVLVVFMMLFLGFVFFNFCLMFLMVVMVEVFNGDNDDDVEFIGRLLVVIFFVWLMGWIEKKVVLWCFIVGRRKEIRVSISVKMSKGGIKYFVIRIMKWGRDVFFCFNRMFCWFFVRCSFGSVGLNGSMWDKLIIFIV